MNRKMVPFLYLIVTALIGLSGAMAAMGSEAPNRVNGGTKQYALIYNGPISAEDCPEAAAVIAKKAGLEIRFLSDPAELPRLLDKTAVFIVGGTEDELSPLLKAFTPKVTTALKDYLRRGGRFLGICGGGFLASTGWKEETIHRKGLGIIPAESSVFQNSFEARILPVRWSGETRAMFFKAGPDFRLAPSKETVQIVATYSDGSIAALMCSYGKGRVAVCGPHPEARRSWIDKVPGRETWVPSVDLAVTFLKALLSDTLLIR
jgi:hypothetical protein